MSLFLRAKNNQFRFLFPKNFLFDEVTSRFSEQLKTLPIPYKNMEDFINSSIQSISFPGLQQSAVEEQTTMGRKIAYKDGKKYDLAMNKEFSVTFSLLDSYLNYWIMYDQLIQFLDFNCPLQWFEEFNVFYLSNTGEVEMEQKLQDVLYLGITDLSPSYTDTGVTSRTFTCYFRFNYFDIVTHPHNNGSQKNLIK